MQQQSLLWDALRQAGNRRDSTLIFLVLKTGLKSAIEDFIRWKRQAGESLQPSAPLFCTVRTQKRLIPRDFQRLLKNACTVLGHQFTPSDLRHTFATELYQETGDLESVRVALGLRSLKPEQVAIYTRSSESRASKVSLPHGEKESDVEIVVPKQGIFRTYDVTDGLSGTGILSLHEDRQGYLWLGTAGGGLYRYDGTELVTYTTDDGLTGNAVLTICEDHQGRLWLGTRNGVSCFDGHRFITEDGLLSNEVMDALQDREGGVWFAHFTGLTR